MKLNNKRQSPWQCSINIRHTVSSVGHNTHPGNLTLCSAMAGLSLFFASGSSFGQAVPLGSAWDYAIISSQGVTSSGPTVINGSIALSPLTTITGFTGYGVGGAGTVTGAVAFNDGPAQTARIDALTAYNTLAGKTHLPANNLTGNDLGGRTLTPGVYNFETSAALTGTLTLDTLGDPNAVFIIKVGTSLTTAVGSAVNVVGAGGNIYWQVGSSATIGGGTDFSGNIVALTSVSFGTGATLENGRAVALNGAVTLLSNNFAAPVVILAAPGRFWNGRVSNLWTDNNWSATDNGLDQVALAPASDVFFNGSQTDDTVLGADLAISSLTVNNTGAVTIGGGNTLTLSAAGQLTGININAGAGLVTINSGLVLGNLSQVIAVDNTAGLVINGVISGANGLTKTGTGTLTVTGANNYTDATVISGGTFQLGDGVTPGASIASSTSVFVSNTLGEMSVLALNLADGETFTNSVTNNGQIRWIAGGTNTQAATSVFGGAGAMHIAGAGTTVLLGTNTFSGGTTIDTPGRVVAGSSAAFGTGPLTILNGSFELPDGSPSTITLGGFNQSGGSLSLHLGGTTPGTFTNLLVDGNTTLTGGTVFLENTTGTYIPRAGDLQNIISTTPGNTLTGQFVSNLPDSSFFNPVLGQTINYGLGNTLLYPTITYDANNADILWVQDSFVVSPALTPNQNSVANALDNSNGPLIDLLVLAPIGDLPAIYDLIAPDEMNAMFQMGINAAEIQNTNITRHLQQARQSAATTGETTYGPDTTDAKGGMVTRGSPITGDSNRWSVFLEGTHGSASRDATFGAAGYDLDSEGVTLGADMRVSDRFVFGILGAYDDRSANLSNGGDIEATGYRGAVFATWFQNNFFVDGLLGAGTTSYDTSRAAVAGFAEGETDGTEFSAMLNTGYNIRQGAWTITPTASLAYTRVDIDGFTETGSLSPLRYPDQDQDSLRSELGVNLAYTIPVGSVTVTPQIRLAWQHEFMDTDSISSGLAGANNGPLFNTSGARTDRDRALFGVGVNVGITRNFSIYGYYDGQLGSSDNDYNTTTLGLKYDF